MRGHLIESRTVDPEPRWNAFCNGLCVNQTMCHCDRAMGANEAEPARIEGCARSSSVSRRKKIMPAALEAIPTLIDRGMSAAEIADKLGCTEGTLRVKCSHMGISLRRRKLPDGAATQDVRHAAAYKSSTRVTAPFRNAQTLTLELPRRVLDRLQDQAALKGITNSRFVSMLLEVIARDDLYAAVLDGSEDAGTLAPRGKLLV